MTPADDAPAAGRRAGKGKALLAAVSLLLIGGVLGIALDRHFLAAHGGGSSHSSVSGMFHDMAMETLERELALSADQRRQIDSLINAHHAQLTRAWERVHSDLIATVDTVHREIEAVLTPEQRARFQAWLREVELR